MDSNHFKCCAYISSDIHELDEIALSYAMTIHKSQGSEYPDVIIPLMTQHYALLQKNLVYTAITRGKKLVILVGQKKALAIAVKNNKAAKRWSMLEGGGCAMVHSKEAAPEFGRIFKLYNPMQPHTFVAQGIVVYS